MEGCSQAAASVLDNDVAPLRYCVLAPCLCVLQIYNMVFSLFRDGTCLDLKRMMNNSIRHETYFVDIVKIRRIYSLALHGRSVLLLSSRCGSVRKMPPPGGAETCMGGHDAHSSHTLLIADMICLSCCFTPPYNMCMCVTHVASACLRTPASQHTIVPVCHMILAARSGRARPISRPRSESDVCTLRWRPHIELYADSGRAR